MKKSIFLITALSLFFPAAVLAQSGAQMTADQLTALTQNGITLQLGGKGQGYKGSLKLSKDGKGKGSALLDNGNKINIAGTWKVKGDKFCRRWTDLDEGKEVCESWHLTSKRSVEVYNGRKKLGVNSW